VKLCEMLVFPRGKIADKAVWSVFLTIWHCIFGANFDKGLNYQLHYYIEVVDKKVRRKKFKNGRRKLKITQLGARRKGQ